MAHTDILYEITSMTEKQELLLKNKQVFSEIIQELSKLIDYDKNNKDLKALLTHTKTWNNILNLWTELKYKTNQRITKIQKLINKAEDNEFLEIKPFVNELNSIINNIGYRSLNAFNVDRFEELVNKLSYKGKISDDYIKKIKNTISSYDRILNFFEETQKSIPKYKYYHVKYELQLSTEEQLKEIYSIEEELNNIKNGEYKLPEDRVIQVVQRLLNDFPGNKEAQKKIIDKVKLYNPLTNYPISDKPEKDTPKIIDF